MLGSCPNKNSDEWKRLLAQEDGNEERALEAWHKLNEEEPDEFVKLNYNGENKIESLENFRSGSFAIEKKKRKGFLCFNCF